MADKHPQYVHASVSINLDTCSHIIVGMDGGLADAMVDTL